MGFDYNIEFRNSKSNANTDGLSCLSLPKSSRDVDEEGDTLFSKELVEQCPIKATAITRASRTIPCNLILS